MTVRLNRRDLVVALSAGAAAALATDPAKGQDATSGASDAPAAALKGNVNHSVARWTFSDLSVEELCTLVKRVGFSAIDLVGPQDWPTLKANGVDSTMCNGAEISLEEGWADRSLHDELTRRYLEHIDLVAEAGYRNLILFSGNRNGMDPQDGLAAAAEGLARIVPRAEERGVVLHMELLNSKVNHPDYLCDNSPWGIALCERVNSEHFKLLYDIYHMQVMEGDVIRTIRDHHRWFGHYHTAGNPGRNEIDDRQELNYPAIARAIVETGFTGTIAQEFTPTATGPDGPERSLREAVALCDV